MRRVLRLSGISSDTEVEVLVLRPRARRAPAADQTPQAASQGQTVPLGDEQDAAPGALGGVHRDPGHASPMAPGARSAQVDVPASSFAGTPAHRSRDQGLIVRMARENPRWGCVRIKSELQGLGIIVSATAIRSITSWSWVEGTFHASCAWMPAITARIDRTAGWIFVVRTMSTARSQARGLRGPRRSRGGRSSVG